MDLDSSPRSSANRRRPDPGAATGEGHIPLFNGGVPDFRFPESSLVYFQFVFAAITPILSLGSVLGRVNIKAWVFVRRWDSSVSTR